MKIRDLFDKRIAIDKEKENVFFFEVIPNISKVFVEFSTDEDLFGHSKIYSFNQIPEQTKKWSQVEEEEEEEEELSFILTTCNKYLDKYIKTMSYTDLQEATLLNFTILYDMLYEEVMK